MLKAKARLLFSAVTFLLIGGIFMAALFNKSIKSDSADEPLAAAFELIGSSAYDPSTLYKSWGVKPGSSFTWWEILSSQNNTDYLAQKESFVPPEGFDFEQHSYIIVYGREIVELEYYTDTIDYGKDMNVLLVTFSEEHRGNNVFFYQLDKQKIVPSDLRSPCFIMNGDSKEYIGIWVSMLNEPDTEREGYTPGV